MICQPYARINKLFAARLGSRLWAVVKANAYGHGLARVWNALSAADGFAMLNLEEAILLRELGWKGPILMLEGFFMPMSWRYLINTA